MIRQNCKVKRCCDFCVSMFLVILWMIGIIFSVSCNSNPKNVNDIPFKKYKTVYTKWDQVFEKPEIIRLRFDDPEKEVYTVRHLLMNSKNEFLISDPKNNPPIMLFDPSGKYIKSIGNIGEGAGEYRLPIGKFFDRANNLYIYDLGGYSINKYEGKDYSFEHKFRFGFSTKDINGTPDGNIISYRNNSPSGNLFFLNKLDGTPITSFYTPKDKMLQTFIARFGLGNISEVPGEGLLSFYSPEYKVFFFDYGLKVKKTLYAETSTEFQPVSELFPRDLSPFSYDKPHAKWWGKQFRPARVFYLGNRLFVMELAKFKNVDSKSIINIHDLDGNTYAEGLVVPFDGLLDYAKDGYVYIVENSSVDAAGNATPLLLHRFKLKKLR